MLYRGLKKIVGRLSIIADTPDSSEEEKLAHSFLIYLGLFMSIGGVIWGTISLIARLPLQSLFPYGYSLITVLNFFYLYVSKNFRAAQNIQVLSSLILPFLFQIFLGGFIASGAVILWSILTILGSFSFQKKSVTIRWFSLYILLVIASGFLDRILPALGVPAPSVPADLSTLFFTLNITLISTIIFILFYYFVHSKEKLQDVLFDLANTDSLTGLPNRRSFFTLAEAEFTRAKSEESPFSLLMIDIDLFKNINDTYGHAVGDAVLKEFSLLLKKHIRKVDIIGRYGGEEFVMLLPQTPLSNIHILASRIKEDAEKIVISMHRNEIKFTISCGIAQLKMSDTCLSEVLKRADDALYAAKQNGRNQIQQSH